ncbi:MAG TPA: SRPBCC family protein [Actinomycetota bacterium]|jgi:uncharacterized protein YndB with AHSA1/START domain|nr:SRPBCC family protein [Actinomycetota bacterium]
MKYGTLEPAGDRWRITYERRLAHPPEKVWRALTEAEHLAAWFPSTIEGDWEVGAPLRFVFPFEEAPVLEGTVLAYEPPRLLELTWGEDHLRFELTPEGGGCHLRFAVTIVELGKGARDGAGWHACLDALARHLDGDAPAAVRAAREGWKEVHPAYVKSFGPEASVIGPPDWHPETGG